MKNFRAKKLKKEICCTNGHVRYARVHLANDPYHTANFNLFPKVQKILPDFKYKNLKIRSWHCNPRIHFADRQLPNYLKRSIER